MAKIPLLIDTDFGFFTPDGLATLMALGSSDVDLLGISVVAGDNRLSQQVEDALRLLELVGRTSVPVCAGADRPLSHERDPEDTRWGLWATEGPIRPRAGRLAQSRASTMHACDFIIEQAHAHPGELTLLTIGPLTNVAMAIRKDPTLARTLKRIVTMGGAITGLPRGAGCHTATAEFNFWVDPEAANIVLRSGATISLVPINTTRQVKLAPDVVTRLVAPGSRSAPLMQTHLVPVINELGLGMIEYGFADVTAFGYVIAPKLFQTMRLFVDVDIAEGLGYGTSHAYYLGSAEEAAKANLSWAWTGLPQPRPLRPHSVAPEIEVAYDVDAPALIDLFVEAMGKLELPRTAELA